MDTPQQQRPEERTADPNGWDWLRARLAIRSGDELREWQEQDTRSRRVDVSEVA